MEKVSLNGIWEGDYFISPAEYAQTRIPRILHQMHRESAQSSGFVSGKDMPYVMKGKIPGTDRSFLKENGQCTDDPYFGRNLEFTRFSENYSWAFRKKFTLPESWANKRILLEFARVDYHAVFFFNGEYIGDHADSSYGITLDVTEYVKFDGENVIAVMFDPAPDGLPNHYSDRPADFANFHRTQIGFGWDWSRRYQPMGIIDSVTLIAYEKCRFADSFLCFDGKNAQLEVEIENRFEGDEELSIQLVPENFSGKSSSFTKNLHLLPGNNKFSFSIPLPDDLHLWYPNGEGEQALYRLSLTLDGFTESKTAGFKTVTMSRNPDSPENARNLTFNINGKPLFVRGVNYVPADLNFAQVTDHDYEHLVLAAKSAGINLFRIWGGGVIEKPAFFEACSRAGIMVWQEFLNACSQYDKSAKFLALKERSSRAIIRNLRNHVCLTLFCGGNELLYYGEIPDSPMLKKYEELVKALAPGLPYHTTSPDLSRPGERHHGPWHYRSHGEWNSHFRQFASELGCNGTPLYESVKRFIPEAELQALGGPSMDYHFFNKEGLNSLYRPANEFFEVADMEQFCAASLFSQADTIGYIMAHYRRLAPKASGCIFWQYNEPWPTASWNVIDYYGYPKMALYALKQANAPVLLSLKDDSWAVKDGKLSAKWFITCDREFEGKAGLRGIAADGRELFALEKSGKWSGGTELLADICEDVPEGLTAVFFTLNGEYAGVRIYGAPDFKKFFALPAAEVSAEVSGNTVKVQNTGKCVSFNIQLSFPSLPDKQVFFNDNFLTLAPGESRIVAFEGDAKGAELIISSLNQKLSIKPKP